MTFLGIAENIISDVIFVLLAIVVTWFWLVFTQRRNLQGFFDATETKRLIIYLSHINVLPFGAIGISGQKFSYQGSAVAYGEMEAGKQIQNLFRFIIPRLAESSQSIGRMLLSDVSVQVTISPAKETELESQAPFIALGSPAFNVASSYIESLENDVVKFRYGSMKLSEIRTYQQEHLTTAFSDTDPGLYDKSSTATNPLPSGTADAFDPRFSYASEINHILFDKGIPKEKTPSAILVEGLPPITDTTYGFVERINDPQQDRVLFYVAGLSEFATRGAAYYLTSQWVNLYKKYKQNKPFLVMLRFDPSDSTKALVVFERELSQ